jgi:hypothetical protein
MRDPSLTGDPHIDVRLEPWRPDHRAADPLDRLPTPGRERRARVALVALAVVSLAFGAALLAVGLQRALPPGG